MSRTMSLAGIGLLLLAGCQPTPGYTNCADVDCSGHGHCTLTRTARGEVPTCVCDPGYSPTASGLLCPPATDASLCAAVSCSEHGSCVSVHGAARCLCNAPFATAPDGRSCVDPCANVTCGGHGTCAAENGTPRCTCETGYRASDDGLSCAAAQPGESFLIYTMQFDSYGSSLGKTVLSLADQSAGKLVETTTYRIPLDPQSWRGVNRQTRQQLTLSPSLQLTALALDDTLRLANVTRRRIADVSFAGTQGTTTLQRGGKSTTIALAAAGQKTPIPMPGGLEFPGESFGCFSPVFYTMVLARFDKTQAGTQSLEVLWPEAGQLGTVRVEADPTSTPATPVLRFPDWEITVTYDGDYPSKIKSTALGATWARATTGAPADLNLDPPPQTAPFVPAALPADVTESPVSFTSADGTALSGTLARPAAAAAVPAVLFVADAIAASRDVPFLRLPGLPLHRHLAAHLAHAGFASLRYDPRGKGISKGDATQVTLAVMVKDAEAALAALTAAPNIDKARIYVLSLGPTSTTALSLIAGKPPKGYIALAPVIKDLKSWPLHTETAVYKAAGFSQKFLDALKADTEQTLTQIQGGTFAGTEWRGLPVSLWKEWLAFDGSAALGAYAGPVLALRGDQDLVIGPEQLEAATAAATKTGKTNLTTKAMTGLAFTLTVGSTADLWESAMLPLEVPTATIDAITAWLKAN